MRAPVARVARAAQLALVVLAGILIGSVSGRSGLAPDQARAQLFDAWSFGSGIELGPLPSARLQGMGGMQVAVPDENNEIHLLDFAGNLAGHLDDKPDDHVDVFTGSRHWSDRTQLRALDQEFKAFPFGTRINMIPSSKYVLGGSVEYIRGTSERLIDPSFRQRFGLPVENFSSGSSDGSLLAGDLRSHAFTGHYVRRLGSKIAAGLELGYSKEDEDRDVVTDYGIDHEAQTWLARGSLAVRVLDSRGPFHNWVAGANGRLTQANIDGRSSDQLHDDTFTWERPGLGFQIHLLGGLWESVKGGLDFRHDSFEGQETVAMNWSAQFPLNPTNQTVRLTRSSFEEGFRNTGISTRWEGRPAGRPVVWGAGFRARQQEFWQLAATNVNSYVTSKAERLTDWRGTAGGSYFLARGRGLVAAEMAYGWVDRDDRIHLPAPRVGASSFELGGGGEFAVSLPLVLRGGYRLFLDDENRDLEDPQREFTTHRLAAGVGYRTPAADVLLDLGFAYDFVDPGGGEGANPVEGQDRRVLNLQVRSVF
jgi:hypothetical protein